METLFVIRDGYPILTIQTEDRLTWHVAATQQGIESGYEISNSFSLSDDNINQQIVKNWFTNLLPEGRSRDRIVMSSKIADNDFALLREIGRDCAGAVVISPEFPDESTDRSERRRLSHSELERWSEESSQLELHAITQVTPRMSLAGAQKKWAVIRDGDNFYLPGAEESSTHIIKAANNHNILLYETYLNTLAGFVGIRVPRCELTEAGRGLVFSIERFDRQTTDEGTKRIHQEDLCQALGYPSARKYQRDGGPSFAECVALVKARCDHRPSILDIQELLNWQIFNVVCGNSDGHAKNISLLQDDQGNWGLAPSYDLVSTQALQIYSPDLAMAVGDRYLPGDVAKRDWEAMARACGIAPRKVLSDVEHMLSKIEHAYRSDALRDELAARGLTSQQLGRLEQAELYIERQIKRLANKLSSG